MSPLRVSLELAPWEREALAMVAEGHTDKEIAAAMRKSEATAHGYVVRSLMKLGCETRIEAVQRAAGVDLPALIRGAS